MKKYIYLVSILFVSLLELNAAKPFTVVLDPGLTPARRTKN